MAELLTDEWLSELGAALVELPAIDGIDGVVQTAVTASPPGTVTFSEVYSAGRVVAVQSGKHDDPDVVLTWKYPDFAALWTGELGLEVAYMRGQVKVEGNHALYFDTLRPVRASDEYRAAVQSLAEH